MARRTLLWLPPIAYMVAVFALSAQSNPLPLVTEHVWDKLLHLFEYSGLALLLARALAGEGLSWRAAFLAAALVASAYGVTDEYHQSFVPGRETSVLDWTADSIGALAGASCWSFALGPSLLVRRARTASPAPITDRDQAPGISKV
jgi:VanZ family protein